jgi:hypothetical protein
MMMLKLRGLTVILLGLTAAMMTAGQTTAHAASCEVPLRQVLVDANDCAYYVTAFRMMGTHKASVEAVCKRGAFAGPQGTQYTGQISTTLTIHNSSCTQAKAVALNPVLLSKPNCTHLERVIGMLGTEYVDMRPACQFGSWTGADGNPRTSMIATRMTLRQRIAQK